MADPTTKPLEVATPQQIKNDLVANQRPNEAAVAQTGDLDSKANEFVDLLLTANLSELPAQQKTRANVEAVGSDVQKQAAKMSEMLKEPLSALSKKGGSSGDVGNALISLKMKVEELDPAKFNFESGWFSRLAGKIPGVGDPIKRYLTKYESAQTVITAISNSLEKGRDGLVRDNQTLSDDQQEMWITIGKLEKTIALAKLVDAKLVERANGSDAEKKRFIEEELLFVLRQRTVDLQQQLAVNQQGILAMELIVRNNKELVRGVNRALDTTMAALQIGVTVAVALEKQKDVLTKVNAVSDTTSDLIAQTAARLKTQGTEIQKQASSSTLKMDSLRQAFVDLNSALEDISKFRSAALPQMAQTVLELDQLTAQATKSLEAADRAKSGQADVLLKVE